MLQNGGMTDARIEPDVQDVGLLPEIFPAARGAAGPRGQQASSLPLEPDIGSVLADQSDHMIQNRLRHEFAVAPLAIKHRDRNAPEPLPGDAPIRPVLDHAVNPVATPGGKPVHRVDRGQRFLAEVVSLHRDEPLLGRTEDDRLFASPTVRVGVLDVHLSEQRARLGQLGIDRPVGIENELAGKVLDIAGKTSIVIHRRVIVQPVLHPDLIVLLAVPRGDVHTTGPGIQGDEWGQDQQALPPDQRMTALEPLENGSRKLVEDFVAFFAEAERVEAIVKQLLRQDEDLALHLYGHVKKIPVKRNRQVGGNRPGGRRPDDDGYLLTCKLRQPPGDIGDQGELHVDRRRRVVLVLDLRLRQSRLAGGAPVDGLLPLVHASIEIELPELLDGRRLVVIRHREIGIFPFAENPEPFELIPLNPDVFLRIGPADAALVRLRHPGLSVAQFAVHLVFNGKPVAVPSGNVNAVPAGHVPGLDQDVLDDLVECGPQVDVAVGVGRSVVKDVRGSPLRFLADPVVDAHLIPAGQHLRLPFCQIGLHRKIGLRQIQCFLVIHEQNPSRCNLFKMGTNATTDPRHFQESLSLSVRVGRCGRPNRRKRAWRKNPCGIQLKSRSDSSMPLRISNQKSRDASFRSFSKRSIQWANSGFVSCSTSRLRFRKVET